ncbi:hypothetical protein KEM56_003757, partial [Ascosphaera pollenicola]
LEQEIPINGSFRIHVYAGNPQKSARAVQDFATNLTRPRSFYTAFKRSAEAQKAISYFERHNPHSEFFTLTLVYAAKSADSNTKLLMTDAPALFKAYHHHIYSDDQPDVRYPNAEFSAHEKIGVSPETPVVVVVRPDNHVACVVRLVEGAGTVEALDEYFSGIAGKKLGQGLQSRI